MGRAEGGGMGEGGGGRGFSEGQMVRGCERVHLCAAQRVPRRKVGEIKNLKNIFSKVSFMDLLRTFPSLYQ